MNSLLHNMTSELKSQTNTVFWTIQDTTFKQREDNWVEISTYSVMKCNIPELRL